jgi:hypothetical protein
MSLIINLEWDSSVNSAPSGFQAAIQQAASILDATFSNNITVNISVGWGEIGGATISSGAEGGPVDGTAIGYAQLVTDLKASSSSAADALAYASLPSSANPNGDGTIEVWNAQEKALGIIPANARALDGEVGFATSLPSDDWVGAALHELTHAMGRVSGYAPYGIEDLFRYADPGVPVYAGGTTAYFSIDGGATRVETFSNTSDYGDWSGNNSADPFNAFISPNSDALTEADLTTMDVIGFALAAPCFRAGTLIRTDRGEVPVEALRIGDLVHTRASGVGAIKWIGHRRIDCRRHPDQRLVLPVRIGAGAFADGMPCRDLWLSPDHAVAVDGALIPIRLLVNGATIVQETNSRHVHYCHIELERHDILFAEGLPAESYLDTGNRRMFTNADAPLSLHPDLAEANEQVRRAAGSCAKLAVRADEVEPIWQRLATRAATLGRPVARPAAIIDPALILSAVGLDIEPVCVDDARYVFVLPPQVEGIQIKSRAGAAADLRPWLDDRRRLGVSIGRIILRNGAETTEVPVDHPSLMDGWHDVERDGARRWRWTDGSARLPVPAGTEVIEIHLAGSTEYPADTSVALQALAG